MKSPSRLCVVGSVNVDMTFRTPRLPKAGETLAGHALHVGMGGKGANQAVAAARLGAEVALVACVGNDRFGSDAILQFQKEGIDTSFVRRIESQSTGTAAILVDDSAENCIVIVPGANAEFTAEHVRQAAIAIQQADAVLCQLETPLEATLETFRLARSAGTMTILTPAPFRELPTELLRLCDLCVPNRTEMESLVQRSVTSHQDAVQAASLLLERGVRSVALTLGRDGAMIATANESFHVPSIEVEAIDTTGAGDAFTAALAVSLAEGMSMRQAASRAAVAASITVTRLGTQSAFPYRTEL